MASLISSYVLQLLTSPKLQQVKRSLAEKRRVRKNLPHQVTVYLRINDPYSYVLLQVLAPLAERYPLHYDFRTVLNLQPDMYPAPELWKKNAFIDGRYLADLYGLNFPTKAPHSTQERDAQLTAQLLHWELQPGYLDNALKLFEAYWQDKPHTQSNADSLVLPSIANHVECYQHHLQANENLLKNNGHYLSAMLHYAGEWYWGLDRLEHLEGRLNALGLAKQDSSQKPVQFNKSHTDFCRTQLAAPNENTEQKTLEIFWSIRSPYSYLGLVRARQLAEHYQVPLIVKPVLPMVMRRMQVPRTKGFYIVRDVKREADKYGIEFGNIADPLGRGVERCYALYQYADSEGKGIEFLESYARGVWAEGIRSNTDAGLQQLVERVGLNWQHAQTLLSKDDWRVTVQQNLADMYANDLWGVPSFKYGELCLFGQDRLNAIENAIVNERPTH